MVSAKSPDFDAETFTALIGLVMDTEAPPWSGLVDGVERLLSPGPNLDAIQGLLTCMLRVDPDATVGPLLYDLIVAPDLEVTGLLTDVVAAAQAEGGGISVVGILADALRFVASDDRARRPWRTC